VRAPGESCTDKFFWRDFIVLDRKSGKGDSGKGSGKGDQRKRGKRGKRGQIYFERKRGQIYFSEKAKKRKSEKAKKRKSEKAKKGTDLFWTVFRFSLNKSVPFFSLFL
jgi:hypothetical protein